MSIIKINVVSESEISVRGHGVHTAYVEMTRALASRSDCQVVVNEFFKSVNADIVHIHTLGMHAWSKLLFSKGKKVVSAHVVPDSLIGSLAWAKFWRPVAKIYMKLFYARADKILAVSNMVAEKLEHELGIDPSKIEVLYNSINTEQYHSSLKTRQKARQALNITQEEFVVVGNGQVQPRKRFDTFVAIAKALPDSRFIWVGGIPFKHIGADYGKMQRLIEKAPANMTVTGVIELDQVKQYLHAADIFVLPATQENHPMAVIEAAAAGLPIVLRDIPEYKDTFGHDAMLCSDDTEFIEAVKELLSDKKIYTTYKTKAQKIAKRFDSFEASTHLVKIYREVINKQKITTHPKKV